MSFTIFLAFFLISNPPVKACSTFALPQSQEKIVAKSYDWEQGQGLSFVNKRGVQKHALPSSKSPSAQWVSKYGSVTFNQHGREFPLSGMNEAGLVVEILWLDGSRYPAPDSRASVNELQWIQYQLDQFANTAGVVEHINDVRIEKVYAEVHYFVCDKKGDCATIEFLKGQPVVHHGASLTVPALANDPYEVSLEYAANNKQNAGDRFVLANSLVTKYEPSSSGSAVAYAFRGLKALAQDETSKWNLVYETSKGLIHFRSLGFAAIKDIDTTQFDYSCKADVVFLDMSLSQEGDVTKAFRGYSSETNKKFIQKAMQLLGDSIPAEVVRKVASFPEQHTKCVN